MALGKKTVSALGATASLCILAGAYFGLAAPALAESGRISTEISSARSLGDAYSSKLQAFQSGDSEAAQSATAILDAFYAKVPESVDIESSARAIASALPSGVKLDSFDFGNTQPVAPIKVAGIPLGGFAPPAEFSGGSASETPAETNQETAVTDAGGSSENLAGDAAPQAADPNAASTGFSRTPFTITVSATSYDTLARYLDSLASQPRLMTVVSIDTTRSETVQATIYAFAYSGR